MLLQQGRRLATTLVPNAELRQHVLSELASRHLRLGDVVDVLLQDVLAIATAAGPAHRQRSAVAIPVNCIALVGTLVDMLPQQVERLNVRRQQAGA